MRQTTCEHETCFHGRCQKVAARGEFRESFGRVRAGIRATVACGAFGRKALLLRHRFLFVSAPAFGFAFGFAFCGGCISSGGFFSIGGACKFGFPNGYGDPAGFAGVFGIAFAGGIRGIHFPVGGVYSDERGFECGGSALWKKATSCGDRRSIGRFGIRS